MTKREAGGTLTLACAFAGGRSRMRTVRFDGLARASRPLPDASGAVRIVTATLGPGLIAGDRIEREVAVERGATLVVTSQMATPVFAGAFASCSEARSRVAAGAALYAPGDVVLLAPGATHEAPRRSTSRATGLPWRPRSRCSGRARACARARARPSTAGWCSAMRRPRRRAAGGVRDGRADRRRRRLAGGIAARAGAYAAGGGPVRAGVGETAGAVVVRLMGARVWDVLCAGRALAALVPASGGGPSASG